MELLIGTAEEKKTLRFLLDSFRLFHYKLLDERFQDVVVQPLGQFLREPVVGGRIDVDLFCRGIEWFYRYQGRYYGDFRFLPLDRVFIGLGWSASATLQSRVELDEFGGFYSIYQSYYHLEEMTVASLLGCYAGVVYDKRLTTLELLRSYFHDSVHFNTFRCYKLKYDHSRDTTQLTDIHLYQIGFNVRKEVVDPMVPMDKGDSQLERNTMILMEGLTDDFSKEALRRFIDEVRLPLNCLSGFEETILQECMGSIALEENPTKGRISPQEAIYIAKMGIAHGTVWAKYGRILDEYHDSDRDVLRGLLFRAMLEGDHIRVRDYFNRRAGSAHGFDRLFRESTF